MAIYKVTALGEVIKRNYRHVCKPNCKACDNSKVIEFEVEHPKLKEENIVKYLTGISRRKIADKFDIPLCRIKIHEVILEDLIVNYNKKGDNDVSETSEITA